MRFFSPSWAVSEGPPSDSVVASYQAFLQNLPSDTAAAHIREFVYAYDLRTALLDKLSITGESKIVDFRLIIGDQTRGYSALDLRYLDASLFGVSHDAVARLLESRRTNVWYDEFDFDGSAFVHRFLLWPERVELGISFGGFETTRTQLECRRYLTYGLSFEVV